MKKYDIEVKMRGTISIPDTFDKSKIFGWIEEHVITSIQNSPFEKLSKFASNFTIEDKFKDEIILSSASERELTGTLTKNIDIKINEVYES